VIQKKIWDSGVNSTGSATPLGLLISFNQLADKVLPGLFSAYAFLKRQKILLRKGAETKNILLALNSPCA
jgi:hypothetical protein